jgi:ring-1,2-phenylacetyl-CoA epoxidase subunit PaaC
MDHSLFQYLLRLGDSTLVLSHRLSEWTGHGPALEEDLAMTNVALDLLGQARMWLTLAGQIEGKSRDEDQLAYLRDAPDYRNFLLVEQPNGHYGYTLARQLAFDLWHYHLLGRLSQSSHSGVAEIAAKSLKEVAYHVRRSSDIVIRLGDGTEFSHQRMQQAIDDVWRYVGELFHDDDITRDLAERKVIPLHASLWEDWHASLSQILAEATLIMPDPEQCRHPAHRGGITGRHTEALGYLLAEMQHLQRTYPGAVW